MITTEPIPAPFVRPAWATGDDYDEDLKNVLWIAGEFTSGDYNVSISRLDLIEPGVDVVQQGAVEICVGTGNEQFWIKENPAQQARQLAALLLSAADEHQKIEAM